MFSVYNIPCIVTPVFVGVLVDKFGTSKSIILFTFLLVLGQILYVIGCSITSFALALVGRAILGTGGTNLTVA